MGFIPPLSRETLVRLCTFAPLSTVCRRFSTTGFIPSTLRWNRMLRRLTRTCNHASFYILNNVGGCITSSPLAASSGTRYIPSPPSLSAHILCLTWGYFNRPLSTFMNILFFSTLPTSFNDYSFFYVHLNNCGHLDRTNKKFYYNWEWRKHLLITSLSFVLKQFVKNS